MDFWVTRAVCLTLAICWFALLISVAALKNDSWYLLAVGAIGMCQNAVVAGMKLPLKDGVSTWNWIGLLAVAKSCML